MAVAVTMAASSLSNQSVGISAEPTTAGEQLAVPVRTATTAVGARDRPSRTAPQPRRPATTSTAPTRPPAPPTSGNDDGGLDTGDDRGRGRGRGRSGRGSGDSGSGDSGRSGGGEDNSGSGSGSGDDD